eukprot:25746-Rhodomonas_salina.2
MSFTAARLTFFSDAFQGGTTRHCSNSRKICSPSSSPSRTSSSPSSTLLTVGLPSPATPPHRRLAALKPAPPPPPLPPEQDPEYRRALRIADGEQVCCYAKCGTETGYTATRSAVLRQVMLLRAVLRQAMLISGALQARTQKRPWSASPLRPRYAMSGTDIAYAATRLSPRSPRFQPHPPPLQSNRISQFCST